LRDVRRVGDARFASLRRTTRFPIESLNMPYATNDDLPPAVQNALPLHAQDIFREAFNHTFDRYGEVTAFRVAWAAVKRRYAKVGGIWVPRGRS
jgi:cation transport regulator